MEKFKQPGREVTTLRRYTNLFIIIIIIIITTELRMPLYWKFR